MNASTIKMELLRIFDQFLRDEADLKGLRTLIESLWYRNRSDFDQLRKTWAAPLDQELMQQVTQGRMTHEEFSERWLRLWGISSHDKAVHDVLDRAFSLSQSLDDPEPELRTSLDDLPRLLQECRQQLIAAQV